MKSNYIVKKAGNWVAFTDYIFGRYSIIST